VLGYSPDPMKLKKLAVQAREKFNEEDDDMDLEEERKSGKFFKFLYELKYFSKILKVYRFLRIFHLYEF